MVTGPYSRLGLARSDPSKACTAIVHLCYTLHTCPFRRNYWILNADLSRTTRLFTVIDDDAFGFSGRQLDSCESFEDPIKTGLDRST